MLIWKLHNLKHYRKGTLNWEIESARKGACLICWVESKQICKVRYKIKNISNVTEKAVIFSTQAYKKQIVELLIENKESFSDLGIVRMLKDAYGNYVVQKLY